MSSDARARFSWLLAVAAFSQLLTLCSESLAQSGQWFLGVKTQTMNINRRYGDPPGGGAPVPQPPPFYVLRITEIVKGSAAENAGLEEGDMIVSVNGRRVTMPEQLPRLIRGSNGVLNLKLKDYDSPTGYKLKTINLGAGGGPAIGSNNRPGGQRDPTPAQLEEFFVPHIGIYYKRVNYQDGTFGAQLTRDAVPDSPVTRIRMGSTTQLYRLERGDTILEMDGQRFRTDTDVRNHRFETTMQFIDNNTGQTVAGSLTLP